MSETETAPLLLTALRDLAARIVGTADVEDRNTILRAADEIEQFRVAREDTERPDLYPHFEAAGFTDGEIDDAQYKVTRKRVVSGKASVAETEEFINFIESAVRDTERPDERLRDDLMKVWACPHRLPSGSLCGFVQAQPGDCPYDHPERVALTPVPVVWPPPIIGRAEVNGEDLSRALDAFCRAFGHGITWREVAPIVAAASGVRDTEQEQGR